MKLIDLFERKQQRVAIAYHGTTSAVSDSIKKHGLSPTPPVRNYADYEDMSSHGASIASMDGVYLTPNMGLARTHAFNATLSDLGGHPMIVAVRYVMDSELVDEDDIYGWVVNYIFDTYEHHGYDDSNGVEYMFDRFRRKVGFEQVDDAFKSHFRTGDEIDLTSLHTILRIMAYNIHTDTVARDYPMRWVAALHREDPAGWRLMRTHLAILINKVGRSDMVHKSQHTFRITRPIKFKGKTRIVAMFSADGYWPPAWFAYGSLADITDEVI